MFFGNFVLIVLPFEWKLGQWKRNMIIFVEQLIVCQSKTDINFALKSLGFLLFHGGAMRLHSYRSHTALLANTSPVYINACNHFSTLLLGLVSSTTFGFIYHFCARMIVLTESTFWNPAKIFIPYQIFTTFHDHFKVL